MEYGNNGGILPTMPVTMATGNNGFDNNMWPLWLLLLNRYGFGAGAVDGVNGCRVPASYQDLSATQNALGASIRNSQDFTAEGINDLKAGQANSALRTDNGFMATQRDLDNGFARTQMGQRDIIQTLCNQFASLGMGQKDMIAAVKDCCCRLGLEIAGIEKAICECCCKTTAAIADVKNAVDVGNLNVINALQKDGCETRQTIHNEGELTRAQATNFRMTDQATQICDLKGQLSNCQQTAQIDQRIAQQTATILQHLCHPWTNGSFVPPGQSNG